MDFVWLTTRRIKPGTRREFEGAWRPPRPPAGMRRAYEFWSDDEEEIVGVAVWDSRDDYQRFVARFPFSETRCASRPSSLHS